VLNTEFTVTPASLHLATFTSTWNCGKFGLKEEFKLWISAYVFKRRLEIVTYLKQLFNRVAAFILQFKFKAIAITKALQVGGEK
jgi:hypothetical protein